MFEFIRVPSISGPADRMVAMWPARANKEADDFRILWGIIEGRSDSVQKQATEVARMLSSVRADPNLSDVGRRSEIAGQVEFRARLVKGLSTRWTDARNLLDEKTKELIGVEPYKASEPWRWHHDIEIARMIRDMPDDKRTTFARGIEIGADDRVAESLLRLPPTLTGLKPDTLAKINAAVIDRKNPGFGDSIALQEQALSAAASAIRGLGKMLIETGAITAPGLAQAGGPAFAQVMAYEPGSNALPGAATLTGEPAEA